MKSTREQMSDTEGEMGVLEHLGELRRRLVSIILGLVLTTLACWFLREPIFDWVVGPLKKIQNQQLQVISILEMFMTYMKVSLVAGIFASAPWWLYQIWLFIAPGLYKHERGWALFFVFFGASFFIGGGAFAYYVVLPMTFDYMASIAHVSVANQYSVALYFALVLKLLIAFGIAFETPLIMWILAAIGLVDAAMLRKFRRYWLVIAVAMGAVLTDPNPLTQLAMAGPLILFFEMGILGAAVVGKKRAKTTNS